MGKPVRVHWPVCRKHEPEEPLVLHKEVEVGSPWSCPNCGPVVLEEEGTP